MKATAHLILLATVFTATACSNSIPAPISSANSPGPTNPGGEEESTINKPIFEGSVPLSAPSTTESFAIEGLSPGFAEMIGDCAFHQTKSTLEGFGHEIADQANLYDRHYLNQHSTKLTRAGDQYRLYLDMKSFGYSREVYFQREVGSGHHTVFLVGVNVDGEGRVKWEAVGETPAKEIRFAFYAQDSLPYLQFDTFHSKHGSGVLTDTGRKAITFRNTTDFELKGANLVVSRAMPDRIPLHWISHPVHGEKSFGQRSDYFIDAKAYLQCIRQAVGLN